MLGGHSLPEEIQPVAVLFARTDGVYKNLPGCDVWDKSRDAMLWPGGCPVVAHPPCRLWGRLRHFAHSLPGEKDLAIFAVEQVRKFSGVLEHPFRSKLWEACHLPKPGERDAFGGFTLAMPQWWFGHRAEKATYFYIVGCEPEDLPPVPLKLGEPDFVVQSRKRFNHRPHIPKRERELTPLQMAEWLCEVARKCGTSKSRSKNVSKTVTTSG
jgi:hypothetical protein